MTTLSVAGPDTGHHLDALIGARVHQVMFRKRVTQTAMAPAMLITQSALSKKLRGYSQWSVSDLLYAAQALDVPLLELLPVEVDFIVHPRGEGLPRLDSNQQPSGYTNAQVIRLQVADFSPSLTRVA